MIKKFYQVDQDGKKIATYFLKDSFDLSHIYELADPEGEYAELKIGEAKRFSGTTVLLRVE